MINFRREKNKLKMQKSYKRQFFFHLSFSPRRLPQHKENKLSGASKLVEYSLKFFRMMLQGK